MSSAIAVPSADFVIAGGGTAGLVLAARMSEIPTVNVAVIEAGGDHSHDVNVLAPGLLTSLYGNPKYDWIYSSTPQPHMNGTVVSYPRGKQLGGSSAINYLAWTHASPRNIDNWGLLGNEGWSWAELEPYYTKSENFTVPDTTIVTDLDLHWLNDSDHGMQGPIQNSYPHEFTPLDKAWPRTYDNLGLGMYADERDGLALGGYDILTNHNPENNTRSYSATSYLNPIAYRPNLKVYTHALVSKVNFDERGGSPTASSVSFVMNGKKHTIDTTKEVLVCGGAIGSPQILELSGIGDLKLLESLGITTVHANAYVGENFQDHLLLNLGWPVLPGIFTTDNLANEKVFNASLAEYIANRTGPLAEVALGGGFLSAQQILANRATLASLLQNVSLAVSDAESVYDKQLQLILHDLKEGQEITQHMNIVGSVNPLNESAYAPKGSHGFTMQVCLEHELSRGSTHIVSNNASVYPAIDPNFFSHPADAQMLSQIALHAQNVVSKTAPLSNYLVGGGTMLQKLYTNLTEANVDSVVRTESQSVSHPCGTCAMLPKNNGGVVDHRLRVYGVQGLRVVDASIFPLIPRGNLQTSVYAVAERAADFIKHDHGLRGA